LLGWAYELVAVSAADAGNAHDTDGKTNGG
jgi:hypothetical protein